LFRFRERLEETFLRENLPLKVAVTSGVAALVVVGYNVANYVEQVLDVIRREGCSIFGVAVGLQGSSLTVVVDSNCMLRAVRAVHDRLVLPFVLSLS